jgi:hypothetical protein
MRAVSQANSHPLIPDRRGQIEAAGGAQGFALNNMRKLIRDAAARIETQEVN